LGKRCELLECMSKNDKSNQHNEKQKTNYNKQTSQSKHQIVQTDITILCTIESFILCYCYCFEVIKYLKPNNSFPAVQRRNTGYCKICKNERPKKKKLGKVAEICKNPVCDQHTTPAPTICNICQ
jgi:hypothetical protein